MQNGKAAGFGSTLGGGGARATVGDVDAVEPQDLMPTDHPIRRFAPLSHDLSRHIALLADP
jgi:hypothetical protein